MRDAELIRPPLSQLYDGRFQVHPRDRLVDGFDFRKQNGLNAVGQPASVVFERAVERVGARTELAHSSKVALDAATHLLGRLSLCLNLTLDNDLLDHLDRDVGQTLQLRQTRVICVLG